MRDYKAAREIERDINSGVRWYLMAAYAYYIKDAPIVSDDFFDRLAVRLRTAWETIEHPHKHLITEDDLWCGSLLLAEDKYPKDVIADAIQEGGRERMSDYFWKDKCDKLKDDISTQATEITRLREENARLREALVPFAEMLKGNYSHQSDDMPIKAGANQYDLVFVFTLGDLRAAAAAIREGGRDG